MLGERVSALRLKEGWRAASKKRFNFCKHYSVLVRCHCRRNSIAPGSTGVITSPVSQKIITKKIAYDHSPIV